MPPCLVTLVTVKRGGPPASFSSNAHRHRSTIRRANPFSTCRRTAGVLSPPVDDSALALALPYPSWGRILALCVIANPPGAGQSPKVGRITKTKFFLSPQALRPSFEQVANSTGRRSKLRRAAHADSNALLLQDPAWSISLVVCGITTPARPGPAIFSRRPALENRRSTLEQRTNSSGRRVVLSPAAHADSITLLLQVPAWSISHFVCGIKTK